MKSATATFCECESVIAHSLRPHQPTRKGIAGFYRFLQNTHGFAYGFVRCLETAVGSLLRIQYANKSV